MSHRAHRWAPATTEATATDTPSFESVATVSFTTAGRVEVGDKVKLVMPDEAGAQHSWRFADNKNPSVETDGTNNPPAIAFTTPGADAPTAGTVGYTVNTRTLIFTVGDNDLKQATAHVFEITNALTPSSIVGASNVVATSQDSQDKDIDTTTTMAMDQIAAGALATATFATATDTPGFESVATVSFTTAGRVEIGGKVKLVMPEEAGAQLGGGAPVGGFWTALPDHRIQEIQGTRTRPREPHQFKPCLGKDRFHEDLHVCCSTISASCSSIGLKALKELLRIPVRSKKRLEKNGSQPFLSVRHEIDTC